MLWTKEELQFITEEFKKGLTKKEVYFAYAEKFKNKRTETSISLKIKRLKINLEESIVKRKKKNASSGEKNGMYGKIGPNKGLNKNNSDRIMESSRKISDSRKKMFNDGILDMSGEKNGMYGKPSWNKSLNKNTDERIFKYGEKISILAKERWENYDQVKKDKIIGILTLARNLKKKDTSIELKIEKVLADLNLDYIKQHNLSKWVFDFYLPYFNFVIECQGDYWHGNPMKFKECDLNETQLKNIERDSRKVKFLVENKINFIFLWENKIHNEIEKIKYNFSIIFSK